MARTLSLLVALSALLSPSLAAPLQKRAAVSQVYAHFILGITGSYTGADQYETEMKLAQAAGIDGFALNIGNDDFTDKQLAYAYQAANNVGFKCFISFDFGAYSDFANTWQTTIVPRLQTYAKDGAAAQYNGGSLVSTFIGDGFNWAQVRSAVGTTLTIVPNYQAADLANVGVDGGFNWNAWPSQNNQPIDQTMTTDGDTWYQTNIQQDGLSTYMAGVSPWFFTHYGPSSYNKNWIYLSDTLLLDRLNEMYSVQPQLIELITWNDFGESSYIGPLHPEDTDVYAPSGQSPGAIDWVTGFPHDAWRDLIKIYIAALKAGDDVSSHIDSEEVVYWYRPNPKGLQCSDSIGAPTGSDYTADAVWAATVLKSAATLTISIPGGDSQDFDAPAGINYFAGPMGAGQPQFTVKRDGNNVMSGQGGLAINTDSCTTYNFNAYVGSVTA